MAPRKTINYICKVDIPFMGYSHSVFLPHDLSWGILSLKSTMSFRPDRL